MADPRVGVALRRVVQARARDLCEYCMCPAQFATQSFTVLVAAGLHPPTEA